MGAAAFSGAATPATSPIRMAIHGRWPTTRTGSSTPKVASSCHA